MSVPYPPLDDVEAALVECLSEQAAAPTGMDLSRDGQVRQRLASAAWQTMQTLEKEQAAQVSLPFLTADSQEPQHFEITVTRKMIEQLC